MSKYGYDSIRKTVDELKSIPEPRSAMTGTALRDAEARLVEARQEVLAAIPVADLDAFILEYRERAGFTQDGTICTNGKTLLENLKASATAKTAGSEIRSHIRAMMQVQ